jgi:hypothetical protein
MNEQEITARFNSKLSNAINNFSAKYNVPAAEIKIIITPQKQNENKESFLTYSVYSKQGKLCDAVFNDIVKLDMLEAAFITQKKIEKYIINTLIKFSIALVCDNICVFDIMIFFNANGGIKLALLKDKNILNYFTVDKLF